MQPHRAPNISGAVVETEYCVHGSTPLGVMAAVPAAHMGKSVMIVKPAMGIDVNIQVQNVAMRNCARDC